MMRARVARPLRVSRDVAPSDNGVGPFGDVHEGRVLVRLPRGRRGGRGTRSAESVANIRK